MVIATENFLPLARQAAAQSGLVDARLAVVAHPIGGVSQAELEERADAVSEDVMSRLLGR